MSTAYLDVPVSERWIEARNTRRLSVSTVGSLLLTPDGRSGSWTDQPTVYHTTDDLRALGMQLLAGEQPLAVLVVLEYSRPLTQSDQDLMLVLSSVLCSMIPNLPEGKAMRSRADLIADLIRGELTDPDILDRLDLGISAPWRMLVVDSPYRTDAVAKRSLLQRIAQDGFSCIALYYEPYVVSLLSDIHVEGVLRRNPPDGEGQYWQMAVSLPFSSLVDLRPNFELAAAVMAKKKGTAGIFRCEDHAFGHLLSQVRKSLPVRPLLHPALAMLRDQDARKGSQLYETLYRYLLHERSVQAGAGAMYVHKNSFLYRLQKVRELVNVDLEDPMTRAYLMASYLLDRE